MRPKPSQPSRIGYVLNAFPVVSETFILNELRAVTQAGVPVVILPLSGRQDRVRHGALAEIAAPVLRPPAASGRGLLRLLAAQMRIAARNPRGYARGLRRGIGAGPRAPKRLRRLLLSGWLAEQARRHGVCHLHAHYAKEPLQVAQRASRLGGLSFSFAAHAKDLHTTPAAVLARRLRQARFAVACHRGGAEALRRLAGPEHARRVLQVRHGVDTRVFQPCDEQREPHLVLAVGRLTPKKGFDDLIRACALLVGQGVRMRCVIVGEGSERPGLETTIRSLGVDGCVRVEDFVPQEQLSAWYARAAVLAMPSRITGDGNRDGIPNVVVEAMACGLPVVATRVGGIPEVVRDGETGVLVPQRDVGALCEALARLLENPLEARRLGCTAARAVRGLDFRHTAQPLVHLLRQLLPAAEAT